MAIQNLVPDGGCLETGGTERMEIRPIAAQHCAQYSTPQISLIAAIGRDGALGVDGGMIWHLPGDLKRFKSLTFGHPVVMGRKTWESLPRRPLPGRKNIIITRNAAYEAPGGVTVRSLADAVASALPDPEVFVIGGGEIYGLALSCATRLFLTRVDADAPHADTFFPGIDKEKWMPVEVSDWHTSPDGVRFRYENYVRI